MGEIRMGELQYQNHASVYSEGLFTYRGINFNTVIQALMWHKSKLFPNSKNQHIVTSIENPYECERIFHTLTPNINRTVWEEKKMTYVKAIVKAKYRTNPALQKYVKEQAIQQRKAKHEIVNQLIQQMEV